MSVARFIAAQRTNTANAAVLVRLGLNRRHHARSAGVSKII